MPFSQEPSLHQYQIFSASVRIRDLFARAIYMARRWMRCEMCDWDGAADANGDCDSDGDVERRILLRVIVGNVGGCVGGGRVGVAAGTLTFGTRAKFSISKRQVASGAQL